MGMALENLAMRGFPFVVLLVLAGCASPQINVADPSLPVTTIGQATDYIDASVANIEAKKRDIDRTMTAARWGTFIGALGLGAAALAQLHKDAAIGFAALGAVSLQGLPLFANQAWSSLCTEGREALTCLADMGRPLGGKFTALRTALQQGKSLQAEYEHRLTTADERHTAMYLRLVAPSVAELTRSIRRGDRTADAEKQLADTLYHKAKDLNAKVSDLLRDSQASVSAFRDAASGIISQAASASTTAKSVASSQASTVGTSTQKRTYLSDSVPTPDEAVVISFRGEVDDAKQAIDASIVALDQATLDPNALTDCKGKLTGLASLTLDPAGDEITLGMTQPEKFVDASGGNGIIAGNWTGVAPPSDLISLNSTVQGNGTRFTFKQLKKETSSERTFTFRISDTANTPQKKSITIKIPKE